VKGLKIKVRSGNIPIMFKQRDYKLDEEKKEEGALHIYENEHEIDTIIEILVDNFFFIYYYMGSYNTGLQDLTLLFIDNTNTLFIGGKRKSCSINIIEKVIDNEFEHYLFWDFDILDNGYVLETGELDCLLRNQKGVILNQVPVDPPWESFYDEDGIIFESIVYGKQFLKFP
jgi:hypothetical protein